MGQALIDQDSFKATSKLFEGKLVHAFNSGGVVIEEIRAMLQDASRSAGRTTDCSRLNLVQIFAYRRSIRLCALHREVVDKLYASWLWNSVKFTPVASDLILDLKLAIEVLAKISTDGRFLFMRTRKREHVERMTSNCRMRLKIVEILASDESREARIVKVTELFQSVTACKRP